jgi:Flp pilus assembly protein TadG
MYSNPYQVRQNGPKDLPLCTQQASVARVQKPKPLHRPNKSEKGQGLIELAIALPVLLLLLMGVLDLGRAYWALVALKDAVSEGATYAASYPTRTAAIKERAAESSNAVIVLEPDMFSVDYVAPPAKGEPITVTVAYDLTVLNPVINAMVPDGKLTLRATDTHVIY